MTAIVCLLLALTGQQEGTTITATLTEVTDAKPGAPPALLCEGTTNLPDKSRIDMSLYFEKRLVGREMRRHAVQVEGGKFSKVFPVYTEKNPAGLHIMHITFDPFLQFNDFQALPPCEVQTILKIGTDADAEHDRAAVYERLGSEIKAILALADEVEAAYREVKDGPPFDEAAWKKRMEDWLKRAHTVEKRALGLPEYKAYQVDFISNDGLERLRGLMQAVAGASRAALQDPTPEKIGGIAEIRVALNRAAQQYLDNLTPESAQRQVIATLVHDLRKLLQGAPPKDPNTRESVRQKFSALLLDLSGRIPKALHGEATSIAADAAPLFDESISGEESVALRNALAKRLEDLLLGAQGE